MLTCGHAHDPFPDGWTTNIPAAPDAYGGSGSPRGFRDEIPPKARSVSRLSGRGRQHALSNRSEQACQDQVEEDHRTGRAMRRSRRTMRAMGRRSPGRQPEQPLEGRVLKGEAVRGLRRPRNGDGHDWKDSQASREVGRGATRDGRRLGHDGRGSQRAGSGLQQHAEPHFAGQCCPRSRSRRSRTRSSAARSNSRGQTARTRRLPSR